jgi:hypothetical protein
MEISNFEKRKLYIPLVVRWNYKWSSETYSSKHNLSLSSVLVYLTFLNYSVPRGQVKGETYTSGICILETKKHCNLLCYECKDE